MTEKLDMMGEQVQAEDIVRWNDNVHKTRENVEEIDKIKKSLANFDADHLKQEIQTLNVLVLTLTPKLDHEKTQAEIRKLNSQVGDLDYNQ